MGGQTENMHDLAPFSPVRPHPVSMNMPADQMGQFMAHRLPQILLHILAKQGQINPDAIIPLQRLPGAQAA